MLLVMSWISSPYAKLIGHFLLFGQKAGIGVSSVIRSKSGSFFVVATPLLHPLRRQGLVVLVKCVQSDAFAPSSMLPNAQYPACALSLCCLHPLRLL